MNIERLLQKEQQASFSYLNKRLSHRGHEFIEDVFCEARYRAIKYFKHYDAQYPFAGWWYKILHNTLKDMLAKHQPEQTMDELPEQIYRVNENELIELIELMDIIEQLPLKQKQAIHSNIFGEQSPSENQNALRLALFKARVLIKDKINVNDRR